MTFGITLTPITASTTIYATLAEFKAYASVRGESASTSAADDAVITDILEATSRYIDGITGRRFYADAQDAIRYYTAEFDNLLFIDDLSAAPTSLKLDLDADFAYSYAEASTDYDLRPDNAATDGNPYTMIELHWDSAYWFPVGYRRGVKITAKWGWPSCPDDIKQACLMIALNVYQTRSGQYTSGNIQVTGAGVVIRPQDVPELAMQTMAKYRRLI